MRRRAAASMVAVVAAAAGEAHTSELGCLDVLASERRGPVGSAAVAACGGDAGGGAASWQ